MKKPETQTSGQSRRDFIKNAAIASSFFIVPRHVLGGVGFTSPSDQLNLAAIGAGGKGKSDIFNASVNGRERVVALCDVDFSGSAKDSVAQFPKAKLFADYRKMLEEMKDIDAVTISTPDHVHGPAAKFCMERGKHVYVQKPMTHNIREARMLTQMARDKKVVTQMGNQGASNPLMDMIKGWMDSDKIGKVAKVQIWTNRPVWPQGGAFPKADPSNKPSDMGWDLWLGPAPEIPFTPNLHPFNWRGWWAFGTGSLGDMACHIMDPVFRCRPILYPSDVECSVASIWKGMWDDTANTDSCPPSTIIHLTYPRTDGKKGDIKVSWYDGGLLPQRPDELLPEEAFGNWDGGVLFIGTKGKLLADCYGAKPRLLPTKLMKDVKMPKQTIQRVPEGHYLQWVNACIAGYGNGKTSSPFEFAGPFTESILIGNLAIRSWMMKNPNLKGWNDKYLGRKKLIWDAKNMQITNFDPANQFVKRDYRDGWKLEL
jgi:hypothetical protein